MPKSDSHLTGFFYNILKKYCYNLLQLKISTTSSWFEAIWSRFMRMGCCNHPSHSHKPSCNGKKEDGTTMDQELSLKLGVKWNVTRKVWNYITESSFILLFYKHGIFNSREYFYLHVYTFWILILHIYLYLLRQINLLNSIFIGLIVSLIITYFTYLFIKFWSFLNTYLKIYIYL